MENSGGKGTHFKNKLLLLLDCLVLQSIFLYNFKVSICFSSDFCNNCIVSRLQIFCGIRIESKQTHL